MTRKNLAVVLVLCLLLACFSACQSEQDEIYSQAVEDQKSAVSAAPTAEPGDGEASEMPQSEDRLAGELTIRVGVLRDMYRINSLSMEFMKLHPGVNVTIDADYSITQWSGLSSAEKRMNQESFRSQLRTEIASGEADYLIFDFTDELDLTPLSQVGALSDMSEFWENDPDLQEDDLFMPVIEAFRVEGKMTAIPYAFLFPAVTFSQHVIDDAGINLTGVHTVGVTQLLDWYDQARALKPELNLIFTSWSKDTLFAYERPDYIDLANETCDFDSPEFVEFLERTKGVNAEDPDLGENELAMGDIGFAPYWEEYWETGEVPLELVYTDIDQITNIATKAREWFCVPQYETIITSFAMQQPLERVTRPYALTSTEGKLVLDAWEVFAMPSSMKDKELGWEFIKYCLSTREKPTCGSELYTYGIPVNKENYRKVAEHLSAGQSYPNYTFGFPKSYPGLDPDATVRLMERGERAMKKMLVYPFNRDFLPVCACADQLIGYEISALVSPAGFGCGGKIVPCGSKMIAVSERIEEHLAECDVVFLAECWFPVDFDTVLLPELQQAVRLGKQILLTENSYREYERSLSEHGLLEAASLLCGPQWRDCEPIVLPLEVPVVYVVGTMQNTGKFQTAMGIKQMLEARGYKISLVGSRCESTLFRDTPFPAYMTDRYYTEAQRIYSFNRLMKNIELEERPDLILVAVPGAVLPSGHKHIEDFGLTATLVQLAAPPDAVVCCSLCPIGEKSLSYYRVIERDVDRKMGVPITAHFSSPYIIDFLSLESGGKQQFLSVNQEFLTERISQSGKTDLFPVGSPAGLSSASESIIRVLGG